MGKVAELLSSGGLHPAEAQQLEKYLPGATDSQAAGGVTNAVVTATQTVRGGQPLQGYPNGATVDSFGIVRPQAQPAGGSLRRTTATHSTWFNFCDRNQTLFLDATGSLQGVWGGPSAGSWTAFNGPTFNGTSHRIDCNQSDSNAPQFSSLVAGPLNGFTNSVLACADLASLTSRGDSILVFGIIEHSPAGWAQDGAILSFGMDNDPLGKGGWGIGVKGGAAGSSGSAGKLTFFHRPQGASATDWVNFSMDSMLGANSSSNYEKNNTRTAFAVEISAHKGVAGLLECRSYMATLGLDGGKSQNNVGVVTPSATVNGGTAACGQTVNSPLTIGAMINSKPAANLPPACTIGTGNSNHLTMGANFGAAGKADTTHPTGLYPYTNGIWLWFNAGTTPALNGLYYCVFSSLTQGTIYTNGPGSAAFNFTAGATPSNSASYSYNYAGSILQLGVERRPIDYGLGMKVVRDLRARPLDFPICLE